MATAYPKSFHTIPQQIALLEGRGLDVGPPGYAESALERYGYYRLSGSWYLLRQSVTTQSLNGKLHVTRLDAFVPGTSIIYAVELAEFDRRLRLLFLEAVERIEVGLRVRVALLLGARDPFAHRHSSEFHGKFTKKVNSKTGNTFFEDWLKKLDTLEGRSKEEFTKHHRIKYPGPLPVWVSIEVWDFGFLSTLISGMTITDQDDLSLMYQISRRGLLTSALRAINHVRNICAHHSRLWNRSPADQVAQPKLGEVPLLNHLAGDQFALTRIYATAAFMQFLLRQIDPSLTWATRLAALWDTFPSRPGVYKGDSGFPEHWQALPLWS